MDEHDREKVVEIIQRKFNPMDYAKCFFSISHSVIHSKVVQPQQIEDYVQVELQK